MRINELKELLSKATKGPWSKSLANEPIEINGHEAHSCDRISAETWTGLCFVFKSGDYVGDEEGKSNAALIALTPTLAAEVLALRDREKVLVEALKLCQVKIFMLDGSDNEEYQAATVALAVMSLADKVEEAKRRG